MNGAVASALLGAALVAGCADEEPGYVWSLPPGHVPPAVPADNPMSAEKVELGRHLFYDVRLSFNSTTACASCHLPANGFSDPRRLPVGASGEVLARGSMGLSHVAYFSTLTWANPVLQTLEQQVLVPLYGEQPIELGVGLDEPGIFARLMADPVYPPLVAAAFPESAGLDRAAITRSLASFLRAFITGGSPYDRWAHGGDSAAMSEAARRGLELFTSERLECYHCHVPNQAFTGAFRVQGQRTVALTFENDGLYNILRLAVAAQRDVDRAVHARRIARHDR
jgi:cytochrome c peroxidase